MMKTLYSGQFRIDRASPRCPGDLLQLLLPNQLFRIGRLSAREDNLLVAESSGNLLVLEIL